MSDMDPKEQPGAGAALLSASPETAGAMLRAARERAGLHIAALAVAIKIPVKKLEALEADQLQGTHDIVFTRALASSVCRALKIDARPILSALPQSTVRELHVDDNGINAPFSVASGTSAPSMSEFVKQPWVLLVAALCAGAIGIAASGFWMGSDAAPPQTVAEEVLAPQVTAPVVIPPAALPEAIPAQPGQTATVSVESTVSNAKPMDPVPAPVVEAVQVPKSAAPVAVASAPAIPGSEIIMSFRAKQQAVWVEVVDSRGDVRLRRNVAAGEKVECGGVVPLTVVIGRADSVDVEVRGKPFNFAAYAKDNVARFEVK